MPFLEHDGCRLYYETCGQGKPLVLLHGLAADMASWLPMRDSLSLKHQLILPDNRLSGRSSCRRPPRSTKELAADVKALLDHLDLERAAIVGHSLGGYVAQEFALAFPERTSVLILESTAAVSSRRNNALFAAMAAMLKREGYTETFWRNMFPWLLSPALYERKPDYVELVIQAACAYPHLPTIENFGLLTGLIAKHDTRERLKNIRTRCLVLSGGFDILITRAESRALADHMPGARFACVKNAGHTAHFELPEVFSRAVASFLREPSASQDLP